MGESEDEFRALPAGGLRRRRRRRGGAEGEGEGRPGPGEAGAQLPPPPPPEADGAAPGGLSQGSSSSSSSASAAPRRLPPLPPRADAAAPPPPGPGHDCQQDPGGAARQQHGRRRPDAPGPAVPECPICGQRFGTAKSRGSHLKRCAARMDVPPTLLLQAVRRQQEEAAAAAWPCGPGLPPALSGLKRKGASSAEPSAKKPKKAARLDGVDEDLLLAVAMSRSLLEEETAAAKLLARGRQDGPSRGRKPPRAGKKSRAKPARSPPPLLLQDPEKARQETERRVASLLSEAEEFPSTPPLPGSHLASPKGLQRRSLWEFSSLAGPCAAAGSFRAVGLLPPLPPQCPVQSPVPGSPPEAEPVVPDAQPVRGPGRGDLLHGSVAEPREELACSPKDAEALQDLTELAGEGLTLTQWGLEVQRLQGAGQEPAEKGALQSRPVHSQEEEEEEEEEKPSPRSCHPAHPLDSLAAAFRGMVNNPHLSDIQFQVDSGDLLYAHLFVLYARCPQLMQMADRQGFTVAEDGAAETCRVLLNDVPGEAVRVFLKYLYTADHDIPRHVLPDVDALATRFGVAELAALCRAQPGPGVSRREEEEEEKGEGGTAATEEDDGRAETFEELLKSMWLEEDEEDALLKCARQGSASSSRDHVSGPELEEIYAFAATQRRAAPGRAEEDRGSRQSQRKEGGGRGPPGEAWSRKGLEEPPAAVATGERQEERDALGQLPLGAQQEAEEKRPPRANASGSSPTQALLGWAEASKEGSSPELPRAWQGSPKSPPAREPSTGSADQDTVPGQPPSPPQGPPKDLRPARGLFPSDRHGPVLPRDDSPPGSSAGGPSHAGPLLQSASQLPCAVGRLSSSWDGQQEHKGSRRRKSSERPGCGPRPLQADAEAALIVVLDSDEEVELGQGTDPGRSGPSPGASGRRLSWGGADVSGSQGPSPHPYRMTAVPLLATLVCEDAGSPPGESPWLWGLSSGEEDGSYGEGRTLLVPDTPLLSRLEAKRNGTPGPREPWARASPTALSSPPRSFPDRPSLQSLLSACDRPPSLPSAARLSGSGPSPPGADVVVVVDDSEEEPEAAPPFPGGASAPGGALPAREEAAGGPLPFVGPGSQLGTLLRSEGGSPKGHFGKGRSWEPAWAGWTGEDSDDSSEGPPLPLTQMLPASMPLEETPTPQLARRAKDVPCTTPLTPPYSAMETPKLKKELSRFGVRALPKRQMVLKLKEIFQYTHPKVGTDCQARPMPSQLPPLHSPAKTGPRTAQRAPASSTPKKQRPGFCQRLPPGRPDPSGGGDPGCGEMAEPCRSQAGSGQPKGAALPAAGFPAGGSTDGPSLSASQESTGSSVAGSEASVTSQSSSSADFESSTLAAEEEEEEAEAEAEAVPASQAAAREAQKLAALQHYLRSKPALHRQILRYQPIELAVLQAELKQNGIRIALSKLLDFLDVRCITFTTAEARREKQLRHRTKKKGRRRRL
ncbi:structure-specific endonuclease subunit SLX4 [Elgaria multicarinata webbii]|uniref:structure-specific endonuclease subunit SLX4 n=1 Tax=Elgaria multicarinata webbii TaxID=159646 RepID=UPI002FCCE29C